MEHKLDALPLMLFFIDTYTIHTALCPAYYISQNYIRLTQNRKLGSTSMAQANLESKLLLNIFSMGTS
jgi:hypothetical protein